MNKKMEEKQLEEKKYEYWFASINKISHHKKIGLYRELGKAEEIYHVNRWSRNPFVSITDEELDIIKKSIDVWDIEKEFEKAVKQDVKCVVWGDVNYPKRLRPFKDSPFALFYKGQLPDEHVKTVSIVGARRCSPYGEKFAMEYAELLARCGVQVISGMAKGIDGIAQRCALEAGGRSFGILGSGVDICYPRENIGLYKDLCTWGGIISEQPLGMQPLPIYFPMRNRLISGLSDVVLIIEAKERSGSLITADLALEQGKEVYALPGMVNSELSKGCNELIKQGAGLLNNMEEFMEEVGISIQKISRKSKENKIMLETMEKLVYSCLCLEKKHINLLLEETRVPINELLSLLVSLEIKGYIKEISRNYYVKI